jgi:hypothetical protein
MNLHKFIYRLYDFQRRAKGQDKNAAFGLSLLIAMLCIGPLIIHGLCSHCLASAMKRFFHRKFQMWFGN